MSYFGHQTLLFEILDLGRMVTNILSGLNMQLLYTGILASLTRSETSATAASTAAATAATATAYPAFAAVTTV